MALVRLGFVVLFSVIVTEAVEVTTKYGKVRGQTLELHNGERVNSFLGIPFAKPPVGQLRWRAPQEPEPWSSPLIADKYGGMCKQDPSYLISMTHPGYNNFTEDCLHLNIYSPNNSVTQGPYPVMAFIHGGGFIAGGTIQQPGHFLAAQDIVLVMINYRLDAIGFLTSGDDAMTPNVGMLDQVQGLKFIQENIAAFGGDPSKVTLFGQSAGGASVGLHLVSSMSSGLFHQAITMSGTELAVWACSGREEKPENLTFSVAEQLNCSRPTTAEMVECLQAVDADTLINTDPDIVYKGAIPYRPVVDSFVSNSFLRDEPWTLRQQGQHNKVPLMSGITSEDGALFVPPDLDDGGLNKSEYERILRETTDFMYWGEEPYRKEQLYQSHHFQYTNWPHLDDLEGNRQSFVKLTTDWMFGYPADSQLKQHSRETASYQYIFNFRSTNATWPAWMGVPHIGDIYYAFGHPFLQDNEAVEDEIQIVNTIPFNQEDRDFAVYWMTLFTNFAKSGNPTPNPVSAPGTNTPTTWPLFNNTDLKYLLVKRKIELRDHYLQRPYAFWTDYTPWLLTHKIPNGNSKPALYNMGNINMSNEIRRLI